MIRSLLRPSAAVVGSIAISAIGLCLAWTSAHADTTVAAAASPSPALNDRWRDTFAAFDAADQAKAPAPGGVVFVGSSSIRLWSDLESQFGEVRVVKRGFGGSRLLDCSENVQRLVVRYEPRLVVVYAGENDLAEGRTPQEVLHSFQAFVAGVHRALPNTRVAYLSIKPSPLRAALMPQIREANALIAAHADATPGLKYINVHSKMLDAQGQPRAELFLPDRLHLNAQGYALWASEIGGHLK